MTCRIDVVNYQEEVCVVWDVDHVHIIVLIKLEELHRIVFQSNLLLCLFTDLFHVHVVVFLVLVVDFIDIGEDLIVVAVK